MKISREKVEQMAEWSKLCLSEEEKDLLVHEFNKILQRISMIDELDMDSIEVSDTAIPLNDVLREDRVQPSTDRELIIKNAPDSYEGMFVVPKILE
ncbi:MAG TPA: Asp-tRNA(Asn)/Glu-tRNA(Gln) amidotransferase subunit GatC [Clostridia bacterium]|nr:Asp-tRNA(Asn)/Glu-tRNA(Gln) amidotransferase subunit GatC [Clostridia bacterium]